MYYNVVVMETFGKWLLRHRKQLGLNQGDVAKKADVSTSYVSTLEREQPHSLTGEKIQPDREKVIALAQAVNGNIDEALRLSGFDAVPKPVLRAFAREGSLSPNDEILIANMIETLKKQRLEEQQQQNNDGN